MVIFNHLGTASVTTNLATGVGSGAGAESLTIIVENTYAGAIGTVASGAPTYLTFAATLETLTVYIGQKTGDAGSSGSGRIYIDSTNVTAATAYVFDSGSSSTDTYYPPVLLKGTWTVDQKGGSVGFNVRPGETGTLTLGTIVSENDPNVAPSLHVGMGATVTSLKAKTGTIYSRSSNTTAALVLSGDAYYAYEGSGSHTAASCDNDAVILDKGTGTAWSTLNLSGKYLRRGVSAVTVGGTAANFHPGATYDIANGVTGTTTTSNKALNRCGLGNGLTVITNPGENW